MSRTEVKIQHAYECQSGELKHSILRMTVPKGRRFEEIIKYLLTFYFSVRTLNSHMNLITLIIRVRHFIPSERTRLSQF